MDQATVLDIGRHGLIVASMVTLPLLAVVLFIGVAVSIFQAMTQVQEMTLTFVPKIIGAGIVLTFLGSWMLTTLVSFMRLCLEQAGRVG